MRDQLGETIHRLKEAELISRLFLRIEIRRRGRMKDMEGERGEVRKISDVDLWCEHGGCWLAGGCVTLYSIRRNVFHCPS